MRWIGGRESENVEDRRGIGGVPAGIGGIGAIVVVLLGLFFGIDPSMLLALLNGDETTQQSDDPGSGSSRLGSAGAPPIFEGHVPARREMRDEDRRPAVDTREYFLPEQRRRLHGFEGKSRDECEPSGRSSANDRLHPQRRSRYIRRGRRFDLGPTVASSAHDLAVPRHSA